jgi:flagellar secretion chaperone FliS
MPSTPEIYLEMQVSTATPQRLRLMLIDGALRHAHRTAESWRDGQLDTALESLIRCREIVGELMAGIDKGASPLAGRVASVYVFLFSSLTEVQQTRDEHQLAAIVRVLQEERETWRQLCDQVPDRLSAAPSAAFAPREELAPAIVARSEFFSIDA